MLIVTMAVDAPPGRTFRVWTNVQGVKEALAMDVERYGGVRVVRIEEQVPEQLRVEQPNNKKAPLGQEGRSI